MRTFTHLVDVGGAPGHIPSGLRAQQGVNTHIQGPTCAQHTTPETVAPKTQTTSPTTPHCQHFSPKWSAFWALHHPKPQPRRHQPGGITPSKPPTRRRHAARRLRMAQNPHRHQRGGHRGTQDQDAAPALAAGPPPDKFRMQFPQDTNRCTLKNRRISTIRFPDLKYTQGNCMRNYYGMGGGGAWPGLETTHRSATQPHWCGGRRRDRRARAGFEARRRTK